MENQEKRLALVGILVEDLNAAQQVNALLHECAHFIVGRMGIPYRQYGVSVISVVLDATPNDISSLCGKLGRIKGISVKSLQTKAGK